MSTQDTSFSSREELLQWVMDKKSLIWNEKLYTFEESGNKGSFGYVLNFTEKLEEYSKVLEKEKITLYRYTYKRYNGGVYQSEWTTYKPIVLSPEGLLKTETKIIEVD